MKIVVIGAGVVGLGCAYELLQDGHEVVVVDSARAGQAASHGNAAKVAIGEAGPVPAPGMVAQGLRWMLRSDSPLYVKPSLHPPFVRFMLTMARHCTESAFRAGLDRNLRLSVRSDELFDEWREAGVDFELHQKGVLLAYENPAGADAHQRYQDVYDRHGARAQLLDENEVHDLEPALSDRIHAGIYYPGDRQIEPDSLTSSLVGHVEKLGGTVIEDSAVTGFDRGPGGGVTAVRTSTGARHACDGVVLAAGAWTAQLTKMLGTSIMLQSGKGYSVDYTPAPVQLRTSLTFDEAHIAVTGLDGMVRIAGTMEFAGIDDRVTPSRVAAIKKAAAEGLRGWDPDAPQKVAWAGHRPMTPDGLPFVGPLQPGANAWVASGHAMLGLTQAPATGREIRELVNGSKAADPTLSVHRFSRRTRNRASRTPSTADNLR